MSRQSLQGHPPLHRAAASGCPVTPDPAEEGKGLFWSSSSGEERLSRWPLSPPASSRFLSCSFTTARLVCGRCPEVLPLSARPAEPGMKPGTVTSTRPWSAAADEDEEQRGSGSAAPCPNSCGPAAPQQKFLPNRSRAARQQVPLWLSSGWPPDPLVSGSFGMQRPVRQSWHVPCPRGQHPLL